MKSLISGLCVLVATMALSGCLFGKKDDAPAPAEQAPMNQEMPAEDMEAPAGDMPAESATEEGMGTEGQ